MKTIGLKNNLFLPDLWFDDYVFDRVTPVYPKIKLIEETDTFNVYEIELPRITRDVIKLSGESKWNYTMIKVEVNTPKVEMGRSFSVPFITERVESKLELGVLTIKAYKKETDNKTFQIEVK